MVYESVCDCGSHGLTLALVVAGGCFWCWVLWLVPVEAYLTGADVIMRITWLDFAG